MNHYLKIKGGDKVLIDIGRYGVELVLSEDKTHYVVRYVGIAYEKGAAEPFLIPADVEVETKDDHISAPQAHEIKIHRHRR